MAMKVALVTGANQGIGYAIVRRLCKEHPNYVVYGTSRSSANGAEAERKLKEEGLTARYLTADLNDEKTFAAVKDKLVAEHGGLDILVNNAGIAFKMASTDSHAVKVSTTLATNVFGTNTVCNQLFPILKEGARVVILSSFVALMALQKLKNLCPERYQSYIKSDPPMTVDQVLASMREYETAVGAGDFAEKGWPDDGAYSMSKLADTLLVRAMDYEFAKHPEKDIVVNAVCPGYVDTNMTSHKGHLTPDEGADSPYYLTTLPPKTDIHGKHVSKRQIAQWE